MSLFDSVSYDEKSIEINKKLKSICEFLSVELQESLQPCRYMSLATTTLEEFYMWVGKSIKENQKMREKAASMEKKI